MGLPLFMLVAYLIITTVISMLSASRNRDSKSYFVAERSLTTVLVVALLFSEIIAGAGTIGNAASAFRSGLSSVWANWGMAIGCMVFVFLVAKFFRAMGMVKGIMSLPQAYGMIFDKRSRIVMLINVAVVYFILYSTQAVAAASILAPLLEVDKNIVVWGITILFIIITITGGMQGIAKMNVVHAVAMYIGMFIVAIKAVQTTGGIGYIQSVLPENFFSLAQPDFPTVLAQCVGTAAGFLASANVVSSTFSADSFKSVKRGVFMAGFLVLPFALMPAVIGICARVVMPDIQANNALFLMADSLGGVYSGLVSMAIIAAIWSTAPALLLIISTTLTKDLYSGFVKPGASEKEQMRFSRIMSVVIGLGGTLLGLNVDSILDQMLGAFQIRSIVGLVLVAALYWPRVSKDAAFYAMLAGGLVAGIWHFSGNPFGVAPLWPAAIVAAIILVPLTLLSKEKVSPGYKMYKEAVEVLEEKGEFENKKLCQIKSVNELNSK